MVILHWGCGQGAGGETGMPQSVQDCEELADLEAERYTDKWIQIFTTCTDWLCEQELINCE